jgi:hypothetical protein
MLWRSALEQSAKRGGLEMRREILTAMGLSLGWVAAVRGGDPAALLTQGKLDADLGNRSAAATAFAAVADDSSAPAALRADALIRLGLVRRDAGDTKGSVRAFERVWRDYRQDEEALSGLVQAVGGALPGKERWDAIWQKVVVKIDGAEGNHPSISVEWPGVPTGPRTYSGSPISLDRKDGDLVDFFRLIADVSKLNVVVHPGIRGKVTFQAKEVRWDDALDRILAANGLAVSIVGTVVEIAPPEKLPPPRRFVGAPINIDFRSLDLHEALRDIAKNGGREVDVRPGVKGRVTVKLMGVPWDQAFDLLVRLNSLAWKQQGTRIQVGLPSDPGMKTPS